MRRRYYPWCLRARPRDTIRCDCRRGRVRRIDSRKGSGYSGYVKPRLRRSTNHYTGHKVLLLEARDRVGGRTWTCVIDGYPYEMGGTWMHWAQPHVWTELSRYGLVDQLEDCHERSYGAMHATYHFAHGKRNVTFDEDVRNLSVPVLMVLSTKQQGILLDAKPGCWFDHLL